MEKQWPLVSIVAVNFRQAAITADFLDSIRQLTYPRIEVILVDNGCLEDKETLFKAHFPGLKVLSSAENLGFAGGNNLAIRQANGDYVLMINNDTLVPAGLLEPLVSLLEEKREVGIVSPKIYYADSPHIIQYAGINAINRFTGRGRSRAKQKIDDGSYNWIGPTTYAHGACMLVRAEVFSTAGLLSEKYFLYYEELDFCELVKQNGWEIYYAGSSHIHHRESLSIGKFNPLKTYYLFRNRWLFMREWYGVGFSYYFFVTYFLLVGVSWHLLKHWLRGEKAHVVAILRSVQWHLKPEKRSNPSSLK